MISKVKKLVKDPFMILIGLVVLVPASLVVLGITRQNAPQSAVNGLTDDAIRSEVVETSSSNGESTTPQPITQAEQPAIVTEKQPVAQPSPGPVCDQAKKQAAEAARASQIEKENSLHERQLDKIRLISRINRRYLEDELARHQGTLVEIENVFQGAVAAASC